MYQALLTRRYLTSKIMPLLAALAVTLCVAMELIVWSVMGGFLAMFVESGRTLVGDVKISWPHVGFGHYETLVAELEDDEMVEAAAPVIESYGMLNLPNNRREYVQVRGIEGESFARVTDYSDTIWWKPIETPLPRDKARTDLRLKPEHEETLSALYTDALAMRETDRETGELLPAVVLGIEVSGGVWRQPSGVYDLSSQVELRADGSTRFHDTFICHDTIGLTLLPVDSSGRPYDAVTRTLPVANQFHTGLYQMDKSSMLVELGALQKMLRMNEAERLVSDDASPIIEYTDPETGLTRFMVDPQAETTTEPARVTAVLVKAAEGVDAYELRERCREVYARFAAAHADEVPSGDVIQIGTWEDENRTFIAAVRKETALVMFIFGVISLTSVFLVLAIFWSMVSEKTRDIGVLRAIGASRSGVAWLWIRYGLGIGIVGAIVGGILASIIVRNINPIHDWLGRVLGISIWDPGVYYFTQIPNKIEPSRFVIIMVVGVLASVLGALWPATRAARMDPVKSLRYE